ncbi:MAG: PepSY domain-containing protein [Flavobacteriaceae bacterium]|jgi:uncharacterized iron-regulated membrane protein|nr:PepSY domain-containing protein [Flavobacteriaceae bacterium]
MSHQNKFRKFINDIHLWMGLGAGIVLFAVCLSGTILTFRSEIEYLFNPKKYDISEVSNAQKLDIETLISKVQKQEKAKVVSITIPENSEKNYPFDLMKKEGRTSERKEKTEKPKKTGKPEKSGKSGKAEKKKHQRPTAYYINPYSGEIAGKDGGGTSTFFMTMMKLHRWLLLEDSIGRPIVGIATIIFVLLSFSGLILWFPRKFRHWKRWFYWKPGFKIKFGARWKRINHDLHNTLGFYSLIFVLIMSLTGLCWSFEWYKNGMSSLMKSEVFAGRNEKPVEIEISGNQTIPLSRILDTVNQELPYQGDVRISLPKDSATAMTVSKTKKGFFALSAPDKLFVNPYSGEIVKKNLFKDFPLNVQIVSLIRALHTGEVFGTFSKILYFLACLIGTSLPVTGTLIWLNKMKK